MRAQKPRNLSVQNSARKKERISKTWKWRDQLMEMWSVRTSTKRERWTRMKHGWRQIIGGCDIREIRNGFRCGERGHG
jgi:hypothetical protein